MIKNLKLNFTIPEEIATKLKANVGERKRSSFVAAAISERLKQLEDERLMELLKEGYLATLEEDAALNEEWESATLEGWT